MNPIAGSTATTVSRLQLLLAVDATGWQWLLAAMLADAACGGAVPEID